MSIVHFYFGLYQILIIVASQLILFILIGMGEQVIVIMFFLNLTLSSMVKVILDIPVSDYLPIQFSVIYNLVSISNYVPIQLNYFVRFIWGNDLYVGLL